LNHIRKNGGEEIIVEIDETKIEKCKYNRRLINRLIFLRHMKKIIDECLLYLFLKKAEQQTLINVIKEWILLRTINVKLSESV